MGGVTMQLFRMTLCGILMAVFAGCTATAPSADRFEKLTEPMITDLLFKALKQNPVEPYPLTALKNAEVTDIDLIRQDRVSGSLWVAEIELEADFGPAPSAVIGFERVRRGRYALVITRPDGQLKLQRFTPIARVESLPVGN